MSVLCCLEMGLCLLENIRYGKWVISQVTFLWSGVDHCLPFSSEFIHFRPCVISIAQVYLYSRYVDSDIILVLFKINLAEFVEVVAVLVGRNKRISITAAVWFRSGRCEEALASHVWRMKITFPLVCLLTRCMNFMW